MKTRSSLIRTLAATMAISLFILSACGKGDPADSFDNTDTEDDLPSVDIFANADPDNSMMYFGWFDGKEGVCGYFLEERFEILDELKKVKATLAADFTPYKMTYPVYALDPHGKDGLSLPFLWTNGYIITRDGTAYHFKYDFSKLRKTEFANQSSWAVSSVADLPNGFRLVQNNGVWDRSRLTKAQSESVAGGILLQVTARSDESLSLKLENKTSDNWMYGEAYALQVLLDGDWYHVPTMTPDGLFFHDIGFGLEPGQSADISCSLAPFGKLLSGQYRVSKDISLQDQYGRYMQYVMFADFTVD